MIPAIFLWIIFALIVLVALTCILGLISGPRSDAEERLDKVRRENYILRESLRYIKDRADRPGWLEDWGPTVARDAFRVIESPELTKYFATLGRPKK